MAVWKTRILPTTILAGTVIGAGIFSLPYIFARTGVVLSGVYMVGFCFAALLINLMYGDLVIADGHGHRFTGFAHKYFGLSGYVSAILMAIVGGLFALTIYLVLSISFLQFVVPWFSAFQRLMLFWIVGSIAVFWRLKREAIAEFWSTFGIVLIVGAIGAWGSSLFSFDKVLLGSGDIGLLLLPFGALLFAFGGISAIPSVIYYFKEMRTPSILARNVIIWGTAIPLIVYAVFIVGVLGLTPAPSQDAVSGLIEVMPSWFLVLVGILGIFSLWSSYLMTGFDLRNSLHYDVGFSRFGAGVLVVAVPFALYLLGLQNFIELVTIAGGIFASAIGLFVLVMWHRAQKIGTMQPRLLRKMPVAGTILLALVYLVSMGYVIWGVIA